MLRRSPVRTLLITGALGTIALSAVPATSEANGDVPRPSKGSKELPPADVKGPPEAIVCRGPFVVYGSHLASIRGTKASGAGGVHGQNLAPGECAGQDRALGGNERAEILFPYGDALFASEKQLGVLTLLAVCGLDENCVATFAVQAADNGYFHGGRAVPVSIHRFGRRTAQ